MRVIAGRAKGRRLKGLPAGRAARPARRRDEGTSGPRTPAPRAGARPTSDLVRGAIFSALASLGADLERVLDLYAGSGALGIEALSRGGGECDFVERDPRACGVIRENLAATGLAGRGRVHCLPVERAEARLEGPYTLVLADPPYGDAAALAALTRLAESPLVEAGLTVLVLEHASREEAPPRLGALSALGTRRHGDTAVSIYR